MSHHGRKSLRDVQLPDNGTCGIAFLGLIFSVGQPAARPGRMEQMKSAGESTLLALFGSGACAATVNTSRRRGIVHVERPVAPRRSDRRSLNQKSN
jgi:hypothetical protein